jgi:hypothetical protein
MARTVEREEILTNALGSQMLDMVAPIYDKSLITLWIFQAFGMTMEEETDFVEGDFIAQMFPETVTWGINLWEEEFGITPDVSKTLQQRREYLMSVMYSSNYMTPYRVKQIIYGITGLESQIIENVAPNTIGILIDGYYENITEVEAELDRKLPAHIVYNLRQAELTEADNLTSTGFAITAYERYELEVLN